jgi:hypothetical protein
MKTASYATASLGVADVYSGQQDAPLTASPLRPCDRRACLLVDAPLAAMSEQLKLGPFTLFIDARRTQGASVDVSNVWAQWLRSHRDQLFRVHMLTGSKFIQMTADSYRWFSGNIRSCRMRTISTPLDTRLR